MCLRKADNKSKKESTSHTWISVQQHTVILFQVGGDFFWIRNYTFSDL
jgi:hypothetical protein